MLCNCKLPIKISCLFLLNLLGVSAVEQRKFVVLFFEGT